MNSSVPIQAQGIIPIGTNDVVDIPSIAYSIPDFEGQAILRLFANSTESEIGCFSAVVTNGNSFSQPKSVGTILGLLTLLTMIASFATAAYGEAVPTMRLHHAHSLSVGVVFAVWQHIFFTGALSMNWPAVLVAWWSNFAWAGGMIHSTSMQNSIDHLIGNNIGNTSQVGAAQSGSTNDGVGGGYDISAIYKRMTSSFVISPDMIPNLRDLTSEIFGDEDTNIFHNLLKRDRLQRHMQRSLEARDTSTQTNAAFRWYGHPIGAGMPLPGNYSGFAGTLAQESIRVSNAFMTGFLWFLILLVLLVAATFAFKWVLEGLARFRHIKDDRLMFFREHWVGYTGVIALRTCYLAFFVMMFLTIFEFTFTSSGGVKAIASIVFVVFLLGIPGAAAYAYYYKKHFVGPGMEPSEGHTQHKKLLGVLPWAGFKRSQARDEHETPQTTTIDEESKSTSFWKSSKSSPGHTDNADDLNNIHDHDDYTMKFGWLASRFRRTRWWFFAIWVFYEFLRAVFYGGASGHPLVQVFALLIIEFLAFAFILWARPFEGRRLNLIVVYCLGFSKVVSVALSAAFDVQFDLPRITTTIIGIAVIIVQGILAIITVIAMIVGVISSYMSISRNQEDFRPRKWHGIREKYFNHLDRVVNDLPPEPKPKKEKKKKNEQPEEVKPEFEMRTITRQAKIEDQDVELPEEPRAERRDTLLLSTASRARTPVNAEHIDQSKRLSGVGSTSRQSRASSFGSVSNSNLPYGARPHKASWSMRDFTQLNVEDTEPTFTAMDDTTRVEGDEPIEPEVPVKTTRRRSSSLFGNMRPKSVAAVKPQPSTDSLRIGGDMSTHDTIGDVPAPPPTRPRSASIRHSRSGSALLEANESGESSGTQSTNRRASRYVPLTPAQEMEEWMPRNSQEK